MSAPEPLVTVAIACGDDADGLELTLDDLFAQRDATWEAVVIDHGSLDEDVRRRLRGVRWPGVRAVRVDGREEAGRPPVLGEGHTPVLFLRAGDRLAPGALHALRVALDAQPAASAAVAVEPGAASRRALVRRGPELDAAARAQEPLERLLASSRVRTVEVSGDLVRAVAAPGIGPRRSVRARSLVTTAVSPEPPGGAVAEADAPPAPAGAPVSLELGEAVRRLDDLAATLRDARHEIASLRSSASWRLTAPLRSVHRWLTRGRG